jgi:hypothetical protein
MSLLGIVGPEGAKFTPESEYAARCRIAEWLDKPGRTGVVSGACHLGGIDVWAAERGRVIQLVEPGFQVIEYPPAHQRWTPNGYKLRNEKIAHKSDGVICIAVRELPRSFTGPDYGPCYHCEKIKSGSGLTHVKSGGCWTMHYAAKLGKPTALIIV